ncbi:hypothetical protein BSKO_12258 [Bryopsis sp. KO-2023]|nr:hypothetical protein BSKO_12258 [Bryopsis sp. KO-2023]
MFTALSGDWKSLVDFLGDGCYNGAPCAYFLLGGAYLVLAVAAMIQFVRIQLRLADSGWTLQKAFHVFNVILCLTRGVTLFFWHELEENLYNTAILVMMDIPTLMFFTTYSLLVLFWAEIVHSSDVETMVVPPRYGYLTLNFVVYMLMAVIWVLAAFPSSSDVAKDMSTWFQFGVNALVAAVYVIYGSKLFGMLRGSPVADDFKRRKMVEVGLVCALGVICFVGKCAFLIASRYAQEGLEYGHGVLLNTLVLGLTEVLVIAAALGLLSDLPPPQKSEPSYEPIQDAETA